jgi:uncharacterized protein YcbK (DUF882 family)
MTPIAERRNLLRDCGGEVHRSIRAALDILCSPRTRAFGCALEVISGSARPARTRCCTATRAPASPSAACASGQAIDINLGGGTVKVARGLQHGGVGYYAASDFVHVDTGRVRYW